MTRDMPSGPGPRPAKEKDLLQDPAIRNYGIAALAALSVVALGLLFRNLGMWSLLPLLVGSLGLAARWRSGPVLVLLALGWVLYSERLGLSPFDLIEYVLLVIASVLSGTGAPSSPTRLGLGIAGRFQFSDLILSGAAVAYCGAHYRLIGLVHHLFPTDARRSPGQRPAWAQGKGVEPRRSPESVPARELPTFLLTTQGWLMLAVLTWAWLMARRPPVLEWPSPMWQAVYPELVQGGSRVVIELPDTLWRGMLLAWVLVVSLIVLNGAIAYVGQGRMSREEAALFLQDTVWRQTCREQRLLGRWLTRARLRLRKRKESS